MKDPSRKLSVKQMVYSLKVGGSEKLALEIVSHLDSDRFQPSVCALDLNGEMAGDLERMKIDYQVLYRKGFELGIFARLYRLFKKERIDLVHTHHFAQLFYAALPARLSGARIIHTEHEFFSYMNNAFSRAMIRPLSAWCERMTAVGPEIADYFIQTIGVPKERVVTVPNGVDLDTCEIDQASVRRDLGLAPSAIVVGTVGRLEPEKDHPTLFEAFRQLLPAVPEVRLLVVGGGSREDALRAYAKQIGIAEKMSFLGVRRDVPRLLAAMDLFVLSSVREGLPISLIEAMAARRPVVASNVGSIKDLVQNGQNGFLVAAGDVGAFAKTMKALVDNPALRRAMGEAGRKRAEESFSLAAMMQTYETLYRSAVGEAHVRH